MGVVRGVKVTAGISSGTGSRKQGKGMTFMIDLAIAFGAGAFFGAFIGVLLFALCAASRRDD